MPNYLFNLEALPAGEYKATIVILADGRKEVAVVTKTQPDFKIPQIQVPFVISHCPITELPPHGDLISRKAVMKALSDMFERFDGRVSWNDAVFCVMETPSIIPVSEEKGGV